MEMTITRALNEIKLLTTRIQGERTRSRLLIAYKKAASKVDGMKTADEFVKAAKASHESIAALKERRKQIKAAVVASNATCTVKVAGKDMTVAEAIERKGYIDEDRSTLSEYENQFRVQRAECNNQNLRVQTGLETFLTASFGNKEQRTKVAAEDITNASKPYLDLNEWTVLDPLGIENVINVMRKDIEDFENEVDFVLSESNAIEKITISD